MTQKYYKVNFNIADSDGPLVLPPLPQVYTYVETSILLQILTARGLFEGFVSDNPHAKIQNLRVVCKSWVGRPDWDMDVIGMRVFPLSLTGDATI